MLEKITFVMSALCLAVSGCSSRPLNQTVWAEPRPLGRDLTSTNTMNVSDYDKTLDRVFVEPTGSLSLRESLVAALLRNPNLAATALEVRVSEAVALQADLMPNPELSVEWENFGGSGTLNGSDSLETTFALSQLIELGGKRIKRYRVAQYEAQLAGWSYEIRRIDVLTKTASDFVGLHASLRRLRIAEETLKLARRVYEAVGERVDAGKISPVERSKASVELAQAELVLEQAKKSVSASRFRLASNWGSITPEFSDLMGSLDHTDTMPNLETLLALVEQNPDLAQWASQTALRQAELELALSQRFADITVTGGVRYFEDVNESALIAGISLPLQIFDRNQGGVNIAKLHLLKDEHLEQAARILIHTAIVAAYQRLDTAFINVNTTRDRILPSAEFAFEAAEEAFRQGKIGALDLFDTERTLFDAHRQLTDALTNYHLAVISCERLIGAPLHGGEIPLGNVK